MRSVPRLRCLVAPGYGDRITVLYLGAAAKRQPLVRAGNALRVSGDSREWAVSVSFALEFVQMGVQRDPEEDLQAEIPSSG